MADFQCIHESYMIMIRYAWATYTKLELQYIMQI